MQQAGRRLAADFAKIDYAQCLARILDDYAYVRGRWGSSKVYAQCSPAYPRQSRFSIRLMLAPSGQQQAASTSSA